MLSRAEWRALNLVDIGLERGAVASIVSERACEDLIGKGFVSQESFGTVSEKLESVRRHRLDRVLNDDMLFRFGSVAESKRLLDGDLDPIVAASNRTLADMIERDSGWAEEAYNVARNLESARFLSWQQVVVDLIWQGHSGRSREEFLRYAQLALLDPSDAEFQVEKDYEREQRSGLKRGSLNVFKMVYRECCLLPAKHLREEDRREYARLLFADPETAVSQFDADIDLGDEPRHHYGATYKEYIEALTSKLSSDEIEILLDAYDDDAYLVKHPGRLRDLYRAMGKANSLFSGEKLLEQETSTDNVLHGYEILFVFDMDAGTRAVPGGQGTTVQWKRLTDTYCVQHLVGIVILIDERHRRDTVAAKLRDMIATVPLLDNKGRLLLEKG